MCPFFSERSEEFTKDLLGYDRAAGGNHTSIAGPPNTTVELSILLFDRVDHIPKNAGTGYGNGSVISVATVFIDRPDAFRAELAAEPFNIVDQRDLFDPHASGLNSSSASGFGPADDQ